jgi:hypothetical protein
MFYMLPDASPDLENKTLRCGLCALLAIATELASAKCEVVVALRYLRIIPSFS